MIRRVVWAAVIAAVAAVASVAFAVAEMSAVSLSLGLGAVTAAILATRESR